MKKHVKISFAGVTAIQKELLIAHLSDAGFDGFEEGHNYLIAYAKEENVEDHVINEIAMDLSVDFSKEFVAEQNWNKLWEENFHPVVVDDFCVIRAEFHQPVSGVKHDIIITPKMSFGTGHHATTYMMITWMSELNFAGKSVLDFGTGTGVLAILADKLGANDIFAIDNDDWSIENAKENIEQNHRENISLEQAESLDFQREFDIILANINKNVLLASMGAIRQHLTPGGVVIMSGLLEGDKQGIEMEAQANRLQIRGEKRKDGWLSLQLTTL